MDKPGEVVVLIDNASAKPVNVATIIQYDRADRSYRVDVHRYSNKIPVSWPEKAIKKWDREDVQTSETRLLEVEPISEPLARYYLKNQSRCSAGFSRNSSREW